MFGTVDALITPVIPEPAPPLETVKAGSVEEADGRPLAFQVVGRPFDEATVLRLGCVWEVSSGASGRLLEPDLVD